eukprot:scaffold46423_cov191-Amphora_coffeaeformis.AAC.2
MPAYISTALHYNTIRCQEAKGCSIFFVANAPKSSLLEAKRERSGKRLIGRGIMTFFRLTFLLIECFSGQTRYQEWQRIRTLQKVVAPSSDSDAKLRFDANLCLVICGKTARE